VGFVDMDVSAQYRNNKEIFEAKGKKDAQPSIFKDVQNLDL